MPGGQGLFSNKTEMANAFQGKKLTEPRLCSDPRSRGFMGASMHSTFGDSEDQIHSLKCKLHEVSDFPILFTDICQAPASASGTLLGLNK